MADVSLATLFILLLPFLVSLAGQGGITGMIIALASVRARIRQRRLA
jgi:hypothetical protein